MGSFNTSMPTITAGILAAGADVAILTSLGDALTAAPTDFSASFVIGASTTPPTKGNSTYTADYRRIGAWVDFTFSVLIGSSWSSGSGIYRFPLPITPAGNKREVGRVYVQDSGTAHLTGVCFFDVVGTDTWLSIAMANNTSTLLGSGGPGTAWATGDEIQGSILYRA